MLAHFLRQIWCWLSGTCITKYEPHRDPIVHRYEKLETEMKNFRPSELIDPRR